MNLRQRRIQVAEAERSAVEQRAKSDAALSELGQRLEPYTPWLLVGGGFVTGLLLGRRRSARTGRASKLARGLSWLRLAERLLPMLVPAAVFGAGAGTAPTSSKAPREASQSASAPSVEAPPNEHAQHRGSGGRGQQRLH
jgi:hypothetical protein